MQAGGGVWHGGGAGEPGRTRGFQLWIALPPKLELGPSVSLYQGPEAIQHDGPAGVLLGGYGSATSAIEAPSPINYLAVRLKAGERWRYQPPTGHTVLWVAVGAGAVDGPRRSFGGRSGGLRTFERSIEFAAQSDAEFCRRLSRSARSRPRPRLPLRTHERRCTTRGGGSDLGDPSAPLSSGPTLSRRRGRSARSSNYDEPEARLHSNATKAAQCPRRREAREETPIRRILGSADCFPG